MQRYWEFRDGLEPDPDGSWVRYDDAMAEIERLKRKLDLFRQMAEKINSLSSERLGEPLANAILGLLAAIDEATEPR